MVSDQRKPATVPPGRRVATARLAGKGTDGKGSGARGRLRRLGPLHPDVQSGTRHDTQPVREALRAATAPRRQVHRHDLQRPEHRDLHPCERNTAARSHAAGAAGREGRVRELPDRRRLAFTASFITRCYCLCTHQRGNRVLWMGGLPALRRWDEGPPAAARVPPTRCLHCQLKAEALRSHQSRKARGAIPVMFSTSSVTNPARPLPCYGRRVTQSSKEGRVVEAGVIHPARHEPKWLSPRRGLAQLREPPRKREDRVSQDRADSDQRSAAGRMAAASRAARSAGRRRSRTRPLVPVDPVRHRKPHTGPVACGLSRPPRSA